MYTIRSGDGTTIAYWRSGSGPLPGRGHAAMHGAPELFVRAILDFLDGLPGSGRVVGGPQVELRLTLGVGGGYKEAVHGRPVLPALGALELQVLEHLWDSGEGGVAGVHAAVGKKRGITLNTVGSALERLYRKGLVSRWKVSHAYRYGVAVGREEFAARRVLEAAGGVRALADRGVLTAFIDLVADVDASALDRLEALIAERRGGR